MNEFTLTADFGMTASDNGFIQYGIHPGDTIMFKKAEDFPVNGPITLKRISFYGDSLDCYLEGGSSRVAPIFISHAEYGRLKVLGVAVSVIHSLAPAEE